jgi:phosphoribosyl 1,2-cyclic phosphodiesterase
MRKVFQTAVLASGSKGNSIVVKGEQTKILIDAGLSWKQICLSMQRLALSAEKIKAVFISHEHSDHIRGIGVISRKLNMPVFLTEMTYSCCQKAFHNTKSDLIFFKTGDHIDIGDLIVHPFPSSHDAIDACNFVITQKGSAERKLAVATDLGFGSKMLLHKIKESTTIILESNHDIGMLMEGGYPWPLKQRVRSINGHLSNDQAIGVLSQIFHQGLENIILAHLSEQNNHPEIVEKSVRSYLESLNATANLAISLQKEPTPLFNV